MESIRGAVTGVRRWRVDDQGVLFSMTVVGEALKPGENVAVCHPLGYRLGAVGLSERGATCDYAPDPACHCGYYAYHSLGQAKQHYGDWPYGVVGLVEGWGRVIVHGSGWRAERLRVKALMLPNALVDSESGDGPDQRTRGLNGGIGYVGDHGEYPKRTGASVYSLRKAAERYGVPLVAEDDWPAFEAEHERPVPLDAFPEGAYSALGLGVSRRIVQGLYVVQGLHIPRSVVSATRQMQMYSAYVLDPEPPWYRPLARRRWQREKQRQDARRFIAGSFHPRGTWHPS